MLAAIITKSLRRNSKPKRYRSSMSPRGSSRQLKVGWQSGKSVAIRGPDYLEHDAEPERVRGVSALRRPRCKIPMTPSPRRLSKIVAGSRPPTQGSGQLYAELYEVARKRCRAVLGAMSA